MFLKLRLIQRYLKNRLIVIIQMYQPFLMLLMIQM
jgi:hypothetical protein